MSLVVTIATVVSFISAPIIAYINYKVIDGNTIKDTEKPSRLMTRWSQLSIGIMTLFGIGYLWLISMKG